MIIVDVEIEKAIQIRGEPKLPDIEYCNGWRDFAGMGISCVCTYDIETNLSRAFLKEDFNALADYLREKWTAGFNTRRFDLPLLAAHDLNLDSALHYDLLEEIWLALGLDPDKFNPRTHGGWGLDAVCRATLGIRKTGNGALAPVWWQQGKRGKVIDYCLNDVWMEGQLLKHVLQRIPVTNGVVQETELMLARPSAWLYDYERRSGGLGLTIGRQYAAHQAKALAAVPDKEGLAAVQGGSPDGLGIVR